MLQTIRTAIAPYKEKKLLKVALRQATNSLAGHPCVAPLCATSTSPARASFRPSQPPSLLYVRERAGVTSSASAICCQSVSLNEHSPRSFPALSGWHDTLISALNPSPRHRVLGPNAHCVAAGHLWLKDTALDIHPGAGKIAPGILATSFQRAIASLSPGPIPFCPRRPPVCPAAPAPLLTAAPRTARPDWPLLSFAAPIRSSD